MSIPVLYALFVLLPNLSQYLATAFIAACIAFGVTLVLSGTVAMDDAATGKKILGYCKVFALIAAAIGGAAVFVPNETQIYTIAGGYYATNNAELKKLPDNVLKAANGYLEKIQHNIEGKPDAKK